MALARFVVAIFIIVVVVALLVVIIAYVDAENAIAALLPACIFHPNASMPHSAAGADNRSPASFRRQLAHTPLTYFIFALNLYAHSTVSLFTTLLSLH